MDTFIVVTTRLTMWPHGEIANIIAGGIAGGVIGGEFGFAGSAVSQMMSRERFSMKKVLGNAANGALEQKIGSGRVSLKESLVSGATNAVSGAIYGKGPLKGFGDALLKGGQAERRRRESVIWQGTGTTGQATWPEASLA